MLNALEDGAACREVLELLVRASAAEPAEEAPSSVAALAARHVEGMQADSIRPLCCVSWNVAGEQVAAAAPKGFTMGDKWTAIAAHIDRWRPAVLALQEVPTAAALPDFQRVYRLLGAKRAHAGYVQLYARLELEADALPDVEGAPAVLAKVSLDAARVVVIAAVHCAPGLEGAAQRASQLRVLAASADVASAPSCVILGDLNVRQTEVVDLLEATGLRDAHYNGASWNPHKTKFDARFFGGDVGKEHSFDRLWFKGEVWAQASLVGACRLFTNGHPYYLSDHFAICGLLDVHASHASRGARDERERRRVDLGRVRDAVALEERGAVRQLEQVSIDRDKADQMRVAEENLATALKVEEKAVRARNRRRYALRTAAYGSDTLFCKEFDVQLAWQHGPSATLTAHASVVVDCYEGLHGVGGVHAWGLAAGRAPRIGGLVVPARGSMGAWLQVLLRLPACAVWLAAHARLCRVPGDAAGADGRSSCAACALWALRERLGAHMYALQEVAPLMLQREVGAAAYIRALLTTLHRCETDLGRCASPGSPDAVTHVDRLFRFWVETRSECTVCGCKATRVDACWDWCLHTDDFGSEGCADQESTSELGSVADMHLRACAVKLVQRVCTSAECTGCVTGHRQQRRMRTAPNVLLVHIDRGDAGAAMARFPLSID
jgi:hypothetical protein